MPFHFMLLPSDVNKQILCSFVDVEDLVSEQTEAGGALQSQLPQGQRRCVAVQYRVAQDETNCEDTDGNKWLNKQGLIWE